MQDLPMATDPRTGTGVFGYGQFTGHRAIATGREFTDDEKSRVHTLVALELPFALHGFTGTYTIDSTCNASVVIRERPREIAGHFLGLSDMNSAVQHLKLVPDNWGYINYTGSPDFNGNAVQKRQGRVSESY